MLQLYIDPHESLCKSNIYAADGMMYDPVKYIADFLE